MEFGIALTPDVNSWKTVKRAEDLGLSHAWFYDSQMLYSDVFVAMGLAAEHTTRIKLGTGVLIPSNRIAPVAANGFATLNALAPGRIIFGAGTGFTGRNTMGLPAMRLKDLQTYAEIVRALVRGETVEWEFEGKRRKIRFLDPEGFLNVYDHIPYHLSAFGPEGRRLAAQTAEGWMAFAGTVGALYGHIKEMIAACEDANRPPANLYKTAFGLGCVLREGETANSPRARAQAGPSVSVFFHAVLDQTFEVDIPGPLGQAVQEYRRLYERFEPKDARYLQLHKGHLVNVREEEEPFVTGDLIEAMTFTARPEELRDRLRELKLAGYDQFAIQLVQGQEDAVEDWARVFETV